MTIQIRPFSTAYTEQVVGLWHGAGLTRPWNDPYRDIERKLEVQPELFLVAHDGDVVVGTVMAGYDGHRGWLYYLASAPERRGEGIARALVADAESRLVAMGCPKVQLMVRPENDLARGFYGALGYEPFDTWATGKRLIADGPGPTAS
jgi:ribosomal protein S18 acetylase RimI-like enzyme